MTTAEGSAAAGLLPVGGSLSRSQWRSRHRVVTALLALHLPVLLVLGLALGQAPAHLLTELLLPTAAVVAARSPQLSATVRALASSLGLAACSALLVHLTHGSIEAHFHFFVVVSVVAFYEEWVVLGATVAFVVLHHLVLGAVDARLVYGRPDAAAHWGLWFAVHALAITAQCGVALGHWRVHERALAAERGLGRQLLEREASLAEAARQAEVLALAADVAHRVNTPVQYASDNARYLADAVAELRDLVALVLEVLPDSAGSDVERLRGRCTQWQDDWAGDAVQAAGDCLAGLEEVAHLVLALQRVAVPAPRAAPDTPTAPAPVGTSAVGGGD